MKNKHLKQTILFSIMIPIYKVELVISYGSDKKFLKKSWKDQPNMDIEKKNLYNIAFKDTFKEKGKIGGRYNYYRDEDLHYIHIFEKKSWSSLISDITHELSHATFEILRSRGIKYSTKSEEAYTYLQGYLIEETIKKLLE